MSDYSPGRYNLPTAVTGDTFPGIAELSVTINGAAPANTLASVSMQFRASATSETVGLELTSADSEITINNATTWNITVEPFVIGLTAGNWVYDIEFTDSNGDKFTYVAGTWKILQDVTR